jgi:Ulp1 family protease
MGARQWTKRMVPARSTCSSTGVPQQGNSDDCGVFVVAFAALGALRKAFSFFAGDIPTLRRRITLGLGEGAKDKIRSMG